MDEPFFCPIPPLPNLDLIESCEATLLLFQFRDVPGYVDFFRRFKGYKILDCGSFEGFKDIDFESYLEMAHDVRADETIIPDVMKNSKKTIENAASFLEITKKKEFKLNAVVQGSSLKDFFFTEKLLEGMEQIDVLSLPKEASFWFNISRESLSLIFNCKKPLHFLGLNGMFELEKTFPENLRSIDSSLPFKAAINCVDLSKEEHEFYKPQPSKFKNYFNTRVEEEKIAKKNIKFIEKKLKLS